MDDPRVEVIAPRDGRRKPARWDDDEKAVVIAPHSGVIKIGDVEMPCSVLADGTRVLHERGVMKALGVLRSGGTLKRAKEAAGDGAPLPLFVAQMNLMAFVDLELAEVLKKPIWYRPPSDVRTFPMTKKQKKVLEPFAEPLSDMYQVISQKSESELLAIQAACEAVSKTNCWFITFQTAQLILPWTVYLLGLQKIRPPT